MNHTSFKMKMNTVDLTGEQPHCAKLGWSGLTNQIGPSNSKSDGKIEFWLKSASDSDDKIRFWLKPDSIKTMISIKIELFSIKIGLFL